MRHNKHIDVFLDMNMSQVWDKVENEYALVIRLQMIVSKNSKLLKVNMIFFGCYNIQLFSNTQIISNY